MPEPKRNRAYLSLGSNIDKERNIMRAVELLARAVTIEAVSSVYETVPLSDSEQESFFNAAVMVETQLSADELKRKVLAPIEEKLGRQRSADVNAPRTIDLDLVLFNDQVLRVGRRVVPDPELLARPHLALPLAEVAPNYIHPQTGQRLDQIAAGLAGQGGIRKRPEVDLRRLVIQRDR